MSNSLLEMLRSPKMLSSSDPVSIDARADAMIRDIFRRGVDEVRDLAAHGEAEACMARTFDLWMFMNRFRNCDLGIYYDEGLHDAIASLNPHRFDTSHLLKPKREFNIAFLITNLVDTGGASVPHRFMLENAKFGGSTFNQYVLDTNLRGRDDFVESEAYRYLMEGIKPTEFTHMEPGLSWLEKGEFIQQWLHDRKIDFVVAAPCPATLFALASRPALVQGVLSQDCYCFTLGPGAADLTFLVTTDQVFKYRFRAPAAEKQLKIMMLPLHAGDYIEDTVPMSRAELGVPEDAVVSGSTNLWKSFFGDAEVLAEGIAALIRRFPHYHHVFAGTPRCRDNLEFFLSKNPDLRGRVHFVGEIKNIYRLLKAMDFWVNSFPTSGGSDIECAMVGKPTIEFLFNRNLTLHGAEFLRSRECDVVSLDEFVALGSRFITEPEYRADLGAFLREKITREFDKTSIVGEKIYGSFLTAFHDRLESRLPLPAIDVERTIAYEKAIGLFNAYGLKNWSAEERREWLAACRRDFPEKPFAWIKSFEEAIHAGDEKLFREMQAALPELLLKDGRIQVMIGYALAQFGDAAAGARHVIQGCDLMPSDAAARRVAGRLLLQLGHAEQAANIVRKTNGDTPPAFTAANVGEFLASQPADALPLYYNY